MTSLPGAVGQFVMDRTPLDEDRKYRRTDDVIVRWDASGALSVRDFATGGELTLREHAPAALLALDFFTTPHSVRELLESAAKNGEGDVALAAATDELIGARLLLPAEEERGQRYFALYSGLEIHRAMVFDHPRTKFFRDGVRAAVKPGDVVLDVGCGTGVLSCFAAKAGASRVYAVDNAEIIELAREVARDSGVADRITFVRGDVERIELPEQVDVLVSEWLGHFVIIENMLDAVLSARDRFLKPGGRLVPRKVDLFLAPIADERLYGSVVDCWRKDVYGLDFSSVRRAALGQSEARVLDPGSLLAMPALLHTFDVATAVKGTMSFSGEVTMEVERGGRFDGVGCHFTIDLAEGVVLDTSPMAPTTHWLQHYLPLEPIDVAAGDRLTLALSSRPSAFARRPEIELTVTLQRRAGGEPLTRARVFL